ncbi:MULTISPECIES: hypothetical protein [unclassified Neorhizobium]|uniref:hypothetical protein n=1 Tax=unclassified Neorhizobium TaxID=2629175 RepID=UPI001FF546F5|nr:MULTISPECIES: hypothetical protein [unclassified Neorhizobium]MCJ9670389.1 hypothetical protein [Neorhizobium sp. SHOUNA12B]MCJ9746298.1 hypothetical protein [Neorhizobium sp. SHOUNA12A]
MVNKGANFSSRGAIRSGEFVVILVEDKTLVLRHVELPDKDVAFRSSDGSGQHDGLVDVIDEAHDIKQTLVARIIAYVLVDFFACAGERQYNGIVTLSNGHPFAPHQSSYPKWCWAAAGREPAKLDVMLVTQQNIEPVANASCTNPATILLLRPPTISTTIIFSGHPS